MYRLNRRVIALLYKLNCFPLLAADRRDMAILGFHCLGEVARPVVPDLLEMTKSEKMFLRLDAYQALGAIGPAAESAVPVLVKAMNEERYPVRWNALAALGRIHRRADLVIPELLPLLTKRPADDNDREILLLTLVALANYGHSAERAAPAIRSLLNSPDQEIQTYAKNALNQIETKTGSLTDSQLGVGPK